MLLKLRIELAQKVTFSVKHGPCSPGEFGTFRDFDSPIDSTGVPAVR